MQHSTMHIQGPQINQFNNIAPSPVPRSSFKRDFTRRTTLNTDLLIPIFVDEVLPGDDIHVKFSAITRMATPIKPVMENIYQDFFWFFIPNRLVWNNWEQFQGDRIDPLVPPSLTIPVLNSAQAPISTSGFTVESIYDYYGLPILTTDLEDISALFFRAYDLCWTEWFRDENLQLPVGISKGDGPDNPANYTLRKRNKRKDYLTSMLPWPQKGDPVGISLTGNAPVFGEAEVFRKSNAANSWVGYNPGSNSLTVPSGSQNLILGFGSSFTGISGQQTNFDPRGSLHAVVNETYGNMEADLSDISAVTINALRQAAIYQQILELDARGGTRYVEAIYSRFGVISPDFRLQRPELIGQSSSRINVYAVPQTSETSAETPQGNLAAFGTNTLSREHGCRYAATEHGIILGLTSIRADLTYQQNIPKMFTRSTRLDFYEPLQNGLGEQAVLNRELYAQGTSEDLDPAGYQERWAEYRYKQSEITGKFRSAAPQSLDIWHLSQFFGSLPTLNSQFIESNTPIDRVIAVTDEPQWLMDIGFHYNHVRPMPIRSNPGIDIL